MTTDGEGREECSVCGRGTLTRESRPTEYKSPAEVIVINVIADWCDTCGEGMLSQQDLQHIQKQLQGED